MKRRLNQIESNQIWKLAEFNAKMAPKDWSADEAALLLNIFNESK